MYLDDDDDGEYSLVALLADIDVVVVSLKVEVVVVLLEAPKYPESDCCDFACLDLDCRCGEEGRLDITMSNEQPSCAGITEVSLKQSEL